MCWIVAKSHWTQLIIKSYIPKEVWKIKSSKTIETSFKLLSLTLLSWIKAIFYPWPTPWRYTFFHISQKILAIFCTDRYLSLGSA